MNTSFEKSKNSTDEWYTPKEIIDALGEFDLDPCAPMRPLWRTARVMYNKEQDGLKQKWEGRVWLNPPYSRPTIEHFITRMVEHNNGIALLFNRLDNKMFQDVVFPKAKGILFMKGRIKFHREDGTIGESPGCGSILVAFGEENAETLRSSNIEGRYIQVNQEPCNTHVDWEQRRYEIAKTILPITSVSGRGPHGELILETCDKAAELAVVSCCGSRMFWFDKNNPAALFVDIRNEEHILCDGRNLKIHPDLIADFTNLPFLAKSFKLVVFDPPHLVKVGENSWLAKKYGKLSEDWPRLLKQGFNECFRVLDDYGVLVFKWNEDQVTVKEVLRAIDRQPLFGHTTGRSGKTMWMCFMKLPNN